MPSHASVLRLPKNAHSHPRLEHDFQVLSNDMETIPAGSLLCRLTAHKGRLRLTSREIEQLLNWARLGKNCELTKFDFSRILTNRQKSRSVLFKTADFIAMPSNKAGRATMAHETKYTCIPPPIFILGVTIAQIVAFIYFCRHDNVVPTWNSGCPGCYSNLVFNPFNRTQAWRYISYTLVHTGVGHIFMNLSIQLCLGVPLEIVHKSYRIGVIYVAGAATGAMLQFSLNPNVVLVGASGTVYALLAAHISNLIINWKDITQRFARAAFLVLFIIVDVGQALWYHFYKLCEGNKISNLAHIGGSITGFFLGIVLLQNLRQLQWIKYFRVISAVFFTTYVIALIVLNVLISAGSDYVWKADC